MQSKHATHSLRIPGVYPESTALKEKGHREDRNSRREGELENIRKTFEEAEKIVKNRIRR